MTRPVAPQKGRSSASQILQVQLRNAIKLGRINPAVVFSEEAYETRSLRWALLSFPGVSHRRLQRVCEWYDIDPHMKLKDLPEDVRESLIDFFGWPQG